MAIDRRRLVNLELTFQKVLERVAGVLTRCAQVRTVNERTTPWASPARVVDSHLLHVDSSAQTCPGLAAPNIDLEIELFNMLLATRNF